MNLTSREGGRSDDRRRILCASSAVSDPAGCRVGSFCLVQRWPYECERNQSRLPRHSRLLVLLARPLPVNDLLCWHVAPQVNKTEISRVWLADFQ